MPRYEKGSQEAKDWAKKMKEAREAKKGDVEYQKKVSERKQMKKEDIISKKAETISKEPKIDVDVFGTDELILPEYFAVATKKGYKLVNPLTQERHLSTRGGVTPFKLTRKAVDGAIYVDNQTDPIPISLFAKKDRPKLEKMIADIQKESDKEPKDKPAIKDVKNKMRGRPEKLPKNIEFNAKQKEQEEMVIIPKKAKKSKKPKKKANLVIVEEPPIVEEIKVTKAKKPKKKVNLVIEEEKEEEIFVTPKPKKVTSQKRPRGRPKGVSKYTSEEEKKQALNKLKYESNLKKRRERETPQQTLRRQKKELKQAQKLEKIQEKSILDAPPFRPNPKPNSNPQQIKELEQAKILEQKANILEQTKLLEQRKALDRAKALEIIQSRKEPQNIELAIEEKKDMEGVGLKPNEIKSLLDASYQDKPSSKIGDWELDDKLSTPTAVVYYNPITDEAVVAHRGTQGVTDWGNNIAYALGAYELTPRYREGKKVQDEAERKYGKKNISTLGHSQGAVLARKLGADTKEIINVNPAYTGEIPAKNEYNIRSSNDVVSSAFAPVSSARKILFPKYSKKRDIKIKAETMNPLTEHSYDILDRLDQNKSIGVGSGLKTKKPRFAKGSQEAKDYMKSLRDKRLKK
jgi:hypothetical protein